MIAAEQPTTSALASLPAGGLAVVVGAQGGIGSALVEALRQSGRFAEVLALARDTQPPLELASEASIAAAADAVATRGLPLRLVIVASGYLHGGGHAPEKSWRELGAGHMAHAFAINAIGPALLMKHFLPRLADAGKCVFAALSARVGSIQDNRLGGWYSYRASKAALNQIARTASIELARRRPDAILVVLHPGTVESRLSSPFAKAGLQTQTPELSARRLLCVIDGLQRADTGAFLDHHAIRIPW